MTKKAPYEQAIEECARRWIGRLGGGTERWLCVAEAEFTACESNGTKRKALFRKLGMGGYIVREHVEGPRLAAILGREGEPRDLWFVSSKAYDALVPRQPDLAGRIEDGKGLHHYLDTVPGISWLSLAYEEQKFIILNRSQDALHEIGLATVAYGYEFAKLNRFRPRWHPIEFGQFQVQSSDDYIGVRDVVYTEKLKRLTLDARVREMATENVAWGLLVCGILSESDPALVALLSEGQKVPALLNRALMRDDFDTAGPGKDPAKWGAEIEASIKHSEAAIARHTKKLAVLRAVNAKVEEAGGWDVVSAKILASLRAALLKQKPEVPGEEAAA